MNTMTKIGFKVTENKMFDKLFNLACADIDQHIESPDSASLRMMAFSCGRMVGFHLAVTKDNKICDAYMLKLEDIYNDAIMIRLHRNGLI